MFLPKYRKNFWFR